MYQLGLVLALLNILVNREIFKNETTLLYEATFIQNEITIREQITLTIYNEPWQLDKNQKKCTYLYNPNDSIRLIINPTIKKRKRLEPLTSSGSSIEITTGMVDNERGLWMHPFRSKQYVYSEIAPFPEIIYDKLNKGEKWDSKLIIPFGWGRFNGRVNSVYEVLGSIDFVYDNKTINNCWRIKAIGKHNKLGESYVDYIFNEEFGFLEINYNMFDGTKMVFKLISKEEN